MPDNKTGLVTAHTPDDTAYHPGLNAYGTTIPRSAKDGVSLGFDPHKPGKIIIDPDMDDGNLEVDFSKFVEVDDLNNKIQQAVGASPDGDGAFRAFSNIAAELADGGKKATLLGQLTSQVADLHKERESPVQLTEDEASTPEAEDEVQEEMPDTITSPNECLEMPFLGIPAPIKPTKEIYFEMPQAGTMGARYHEVIEGGSCIALVYDTRYEEGYQWIPPSLGDAKIKMTIPKDKKTYTCSSLGIHFHIGVLDVVVLFKHDDDDAIKENY